MMRRRLAAVAACASIVACGGGDEAPSVVRRQAPPAPAAAGGETVPHGDHNPHHDGVVLMNGDLHFEVVLGRDGTCRVFFSDAVRNDLPAATASEVVVTVTQKGREPESIPMHIDDSGESWIGRGHPVEDPAATARVSHTVNGKPYFIDIPFPR